MAAVEYTIRFANDVISFPERDEGRGSRFVATLNDAAVSDEVLNGLLSRLGAETFVPVAPHYRHLPEPSYDRWGNEVELIDMTDDYSVAFARELGEEDLRALNALRSVTYAAPSSPGTFFFIPDDEYFDDQWALQNTGQTLDFLLCNPFATPIADYDIDATGAWDKVIAPGCKIGIIDTGIRATHEDLADSIDDFISEQTDNCGHGTAISGVAAAAGNNSVGIAGVAHPDVDSAFPMLVVLKNVATGCAPSPTLTAGVLADLANNNDFAEVRVVNESFGVTHSPYLRDSHRNAYVQGLLVVAASGNFPCNEPVPESCEIYPASYDNFVTAVSGLTPGGENPFPPFSHTDIVAASDNNVTTSYLNDSAYMGYDEGTICGTSFSAPIVTAAAAMLLGANGGLTNDDLREVLLRTADDLGPPGRDDTFGHGQLKMAAAIDYVSAPNKVYQRTTSSFSAALVETRTQQFANLPFSARADSLQAFIADVYELEITASFAAQGVGETVVDVWSRPRLSDGLPNEDRIDAALFTSYLEADLSTLTSSSVKFYTYTFRVLDQADSSCLGWYPVIVPGLGSCGTGAASVPNFDYTFVTTPSGSRPVAKDGSPAAPTLTVETIGSTISLTAEGMDGAADTTYEFQVVDVSGRVVRSASTRGETSATIRSDGLPAGIYLAVVRSGDNTATTKLRIIR